jgi:hypothetical protein
MSLVVTVAAHTVPLCHHCRTRLVQRCTSAVEGHDSGFLPVVLVGGKTYHAPCAGARSGDVPVTNACLCGSHVDLPCTTGPCYLWHDDRNERAPLLRALHAKCVSALVRVIGGGGVLTDRSVYDLALYASPAPAPGKPVAPLLIDAWAPGASIPGNPPLPIHVSVSRTALPKVAAEYSASVRNCLKSRGRTDLLYLGMLSVKRIEQAVPHTESMATFMSRVATSLTDAGSTIYAVHPGSNERDVWFIEAAVQTDGPIRTVVREFGEKAYVNWFPWFVDDSIRVSTGVIHVTAERAILPPWRAESAGAPRPGAPAPGHP